MGSGASAGGDTKIADKETTIVEFGNDGQLVRHLSQKAWADVERILIVFDPRSDAFKCAEPPADWTDDVKSKIVTFVLMPSLTSSPECLCCAEVGFQALCAPGLPMKDVRIIRVDDYLDKGHDILRAMIEKDKKVYPAEEVDSMLDFFRADKALGYKESWEDDDGKMEEEITEDGDRFNTNVYRLRAWCHWPVRSGVEEGAVYEGISMVKELLSGDGALPSLGPVPSECKAPKAFQGSKLSPAAVVFSKEALDKYSKIFKMPVLLPENFVSEKDKYPILLMEPEDLRADPEKKGYVSRGCEFMRKLREEKPDSSLIAVVLDKDFETMKTNSWLVLAIHQLIENSDATIFANFSEAEQVSNFFTKTKHATEHVGKSLCMQCIPFPRLHFFTMKTAMGQDLAKHDIMFPAVTVGSKVAGIPAEKFNSQCPWSPFFLTGKDLKPLAPERLVAGADGFDGETVIMPQSVLLKLFKDVKHKFPKSSFDDEEEEGMGNEAEGPKTPLWETVFGVDYKDWEEMELIEAESNLSDLVCEYDQYLSSAAPGDKKPL